MPQELSYFRVGLDDETTALLMELSEACHCAPTSLLGALVRDLLKEDAAIEQIHAGPERHYLDS